MANVHRSRRPSLWTLNRRPPPVNLMVDRSHPMAPAAYFAFNGAGVLELIKGSYTASTATNFPAVTSAGIGQRMTASLVGPRLSNADLGITNKFSAFCMMRGANTNVGKQVFCRPFAATHTTPFGAFGFYVAGVGNNEWRVTNETNTSVIVTTSVDVINNTWNLCGGTWDGTAALTTVWTNLISNVGAISGVTLSDSQNFMIGGNRSATEDFSGELLWIGIWNRVLDAQAVASLYYDPYEFLISGQ